MRDCPIYLVLTESHIFLLKLEVIFFVPIGTGDGTQQITLTHATTFDEALQLFQETIGCIGLKRQPVLSYRLSTATAKSDWINLKTESDWEGCLEDVEREQVKKKEVSVPVNLVVGDAVCHVY